MKEQGEYPRQYEKRNDYPPGERRQYDKKKDYQNDKNYKDYKKPQYMEREKKPEESTPLDANNKFFPGSSTQDNELKIPRFTRSTVKE